MASGIRHISFGFELCFKADTFPVGRHFKIGQWLQSEDNTPTFPFDQLATYA